MYYFFNFQKLLRHDHFSWLKQKPLNIYPKSGSMLVQCWCSFVMNRTDYNNVIQKMIDKILEETTDKNTLEDLKFFQEFLQRNFKRLWKWWWYEPESNQPAISHSTAKTHKFENLQDMKPQNLKCYLKYRSNRHIYG